MTDTRENTTLRFGAGDLQHIGTLTHTLSQGESLLDCKDAFIVPDGLFDNTLLALENNIESDSTFLSLASDFENDNAFLGSDFGYDTNFFPVAKDIDHATSFSSLSGNSVLNNLPFEEISKSLPERSNISISEDVRNILCTKCDSLFKSQNELDDHMELNHGTIYECSVCRHMCRKLNEMAIHMQIHIDEEKWNNNGKRSPEPMPDSETKVFYNQNISREQQHSPVPENTQNELSNELIEERSWKCTQCAYITNNICNLKKHMRVHTGEKPFQCTQCDYKCSDNSTMRRHMRTHTGEKLFSCNQCDYMGHSKWNIRQHKKKHKQEALEASQQFIYTESEESSNSDSQSIGDQSFRSNASTSPLQMHSPQNGLDILSQPLPDLSSLGLISNIDSSLADAIHCSNLLTPNSESGSVLSRSISPTENKISPTLNRNSSSRNRYSGYKDLHRETDNFAYICSGCSNKSSYASPHENHNLFVSGEKSFMCSECYVKSIIANVASEIQNEKYACTKCDYKCNHKNDLKHHKVTHKST